jgi:hypothetical protein
MQPALNASMFQRVFQLACFPESSIPARAFEVRISVDDAVQNIFFAGIATLQCKNIARSSHLLSVAVLRHADWILPRYARARYLAQFGSLIKMR